MYEYFSDSLLHRSDMVIEDIPKDLVAETKERREMLIGEIPNIKHQIVFR